MRRCCADFHTRHLTTFTIFGEQAQQEFASASFLSRLPGLPTEPGAGRTRGLQRRWGIMTGRGEPERVFAPSASANFFSVLGWSPSLAHVSAG